MARDIARSGSLEAIGDDLPHVRVVGQPDVGRRDFDVLRLGRRAVDAGRGLYDAVVAAPDRRDRGLDRGPFPLLDEIRNALDTARR